MRFVAPMPEQIENPYNALLCGVQGLIEKCIVVVPICYKMSATNLNFWFPWYQTNTKIWQWLAVRVVTVVLLTKSSWILFLLETWHEVYVIASTWLVYAYYWN